MNEDIRWMQLSDLHIGNPEYRWTDNTLKERLLYFFTEAHPSHLQFIIITGDIINKGDLTDSHNVDELCSFIEILLQFTDKIIIAPGNHDYKRNEPRFDLLINWGKETNKKKAEKDFSKKLRADFEECKEIFNKYGNKVVFTDKSDVILLDDINVVSLNTSVFSGQPEGDDRKKINDDGKLWICENDFPKDSSLNKEHPTIMIGHHPFRMFSSECIERLETFSNTCNIKYYFCGHMHRQEVDSSLVVQHISSGLFKSQYNEPSFAIYYLKKNANETLNSEYYVWDDKEWKRRNDEKEEKEGKKETKKDEVIEKFEAPFTIEPSDISDGALRLPYGEGKFNIYVSKYHPGSVIIPHKHEDLDEITYVTKGKLIVAIDDKVHILSEGNALVMPKGKFHGLIPASFPCEYLTMSVEVEPNPQSDWQKKIEEIRKIDEKISSGKYTLEIYDSVIEYLSSSIMEVRWEAEEVLNKCLVQEDNDDNVYIREAIGTKIRPYLQNKAELEKQFCGISIAYDLGINISDKTISDLLISDNFMITWVCAYYVIKLRKGKELKKIFNKIPEKNTYQRVIVAILQLIVNHDSSFLQKYEGKIGGELSIEDILMHFIYWYTSFTYMDQELDFLNAAKEFRNIFDEEGEQILRGFTNVHDNFERYNQILKCKGKLMDAACSYFRNIQSNNEDVTKDTTKDRIQNYLRIIVSEKCNLNCVYCHHEGRIDSLNGSEVEDNNDFDLRELLTKCKKLNVKKIKISGGEPLLYPNVLSICNEFDFEDIGFTTNGTQVITLKDEFEKIKGSKLTFNVTLNSLDPMKNERITGSDELCNTQQGIEYLIDNGFSVKINSVITSYNLDEVEALISYAAKMKVNIKLLDLFAVEGTPEEFKHVSISEIKSEVKKIFRLQENDFIRKNDYLIAEVMGIKVMIPSRIYSVDCQYNCKMYPCAEGIFGIRVYEDYSCAKCLNGKVYKGGIEKLDKNIETVQKELNSMKLYY